MEPTPIESKEQLHKRTCNKYLVIDNYSSGTVALKYKMENGLVIIGGNRRFWPLVYKIVDMFFGKKVQYIASDKLSLKDKDSLKSNAYLKSAIPDTHSQKNKIKYEFKISLESWRKVSETFDNSTEFSFELVASHGRVL